MSSSLDSGEADKIRSELIVAYRQGFRVVLIVGGGLAAAATLMVVFLMPQVTLDRPDEKLKEEGKKAEEESKGLGAADQATDVSATGTHMQA